MNEELKMRKLYEQLIAFWNMRSGDKISSLFADDGSIVGFDGTQENGRENINARLNEIFKNYKSNPFVYLIREVRFLSDSTALLRAVAGIMPEYGAEMNPDLNTIQSIVTVKKGDEWKIALLQITPASWLGRPEEVKALTKELEDAFKSAHGL
ncbi:SgcJ/EcaC family oxidoreductase [Pinibacter aurantiacus]|uniref:SgcJ/EcaC family oxidoreductase n=1 Tax=Pinibacter aurantiacus TaxID=2851599 RepID=A0A9E2SBW1_9BACT|nr:SgcJ/EcaC family oxidoreductase [Pinibacter aurantiacus]MBV4358644.1 SgcJ/EcaC family oxidoreductase [Pinibacter aurantiacus]